VNDSKSARNRKPLPEIGTTYGEHSILWRHHTLGTAKPYGGREVSVGGRRSSAFEP